MKATVDSAGRVLIPKALREAVGLSVGCEVDISEYGAGLQLAPVQAAPKLERNRHGRLVSVAPGHMTDAVIRQTLDQIRR